MAKLPNVVFFTCESCGQELRKTDCIGEHLVPSRRSQAIRDNGRCRQCEGQSWSMKVVYAEDALTSEFAIDLGVAAVASNFVGVGVTTLATAALSDWSIESNEWLYKNIPASVVAKLNSEPRHVLQRVADLARTMGRAKMFESGAKDCAECGMIFMPAEHKSWNQLGFCSRVCATHAETEEPVFVEIPAEQEVDLIGA